MKSTQVGNKFVITGGNMRDTAKGPYIRHHFPVGEVVTLVGGTHEDYGYYEDEKGYEQGVSDRFVKPFEEEEISVIKANVGDKFLVVDGDGAFELGETVTLTRYDGDGFNIYENASGKSRAVKDSRLRKLDGVSVGDKFEVVSNRGDFHSFEEGTIVLVQFLCGDGIHCYVDAEGDTQYVMPRDLIPYVEKEVAAPVEGDKFIVTGNSSPTHYYDIGTEVTYKGYISGSGSLSVTKGGNCLGQFINPRDLTAVAPVGKTTKPEAQVGDYITIDFAAVERRDSPRTVDLTKGKAYLVKANEDGELYFIDDVGDTRIQHIEHGLYDVVSSPIKEGDFAEVIADGYSDSYKSHDIEIGTIVKVKAVGRYGRQKYEATPVGSPDEWESSRYFVEGDLRKVDAPVEEKKRPKVGDKIRITGNGFKNGGIFGPHYGKIGDIETVTGVREDRVIVTNANAVHDDFYELVEEIVDVELVAEPVEEVTFEDGDIVRITRDTSSQNREGDIGIVEMNDFGTIKVFVNARGNESNYHAEDSLELIAKGRK